MLSPAELAQLRIDVLETLVDTCRIERDAGTNLYGDHVPNWGTAIASAVCRFDPDTLRRDQETVAGREAGVARYIVSLEHDTDVRDGDRLIYNGGTFEIIQLHIKHSLNAFRRLRVSEIMGE